MKLTLETAAQQRRYLIEDLKRQIRVTEAKIAYEGLIEADRDGTVLDLQVTAGQTVGTGQRLGTIGRPDAASASKLPLELVAYFNPADARRLPLGLPVEVVPLWNQRGRFGGITGKVTQVLSLPASVDDISTTIGNPPAGPRTHQKWTGDAGRYQLGPGSGQQRWLPLDPLGVRRRLGRRVAPTT